MHFCMFLSCHDYQTCIVLRSNILLFIFAAMLVGFKVRENTLKQLRKLKPDTYDDPVRNEDLISLSSHCSGVQ